MTIAWLFSPRKRRAQEGMEAPPPEPAPVQKNLRYRIRRIV